MITLLTVIKNKKERNPHVNNQLENSQGIRRYHL